MLFKKRSGRQDILKTNKPASHKFGSTKISSLDSIIVSFIINLKVSSLLLKQSILLQYLWLFLYYDLHNLETHYVSDSGSPVLTLIGQFQFSCSHNISGRAFLALWCLCVGIQATYKKGKEEAGEIGSERSLVTVPAALPRHPPTC